MLQILLSFHLSQGTLWFCQCGHWFLGHLPDQCPSCTVAQFGRTASSRKSLGISIFFPFPNDEAHCALGNFQRSRNCFIPFPRSTPPHTSISEFYGQFLGPYGSVSALTCTVNCGTSYRKVCFFLNHVRSIELTPGGLQSSCRDISRTIKGDWMHQSSTWSVIAKGLNTYWYCTFHLFILNSFVKNSKNMFSLFHYGVFYVDRCQKIKI